MYHSITLLELNGTYGGIKITSPGYEWQEGLYTAFKDNGYTGFIDAKTGAGKTIGACKILVEYMQDFPDSIIWVVAPNRDLLNQWRKTLEEYNLDHVETYTYIKAVNNLRAYRRGVKADNTPDLLICDEAHALASKTGTVWKEVINFGIPHVLGMSATPRGAEEILGGNIIKVGYEDCNIAPSLNNCVIFTPTPSEMNAYNEATSVMRGYAEGRNVSFYNDPTYAMFVMRRRRVLQSMHSRFILAMKYLKANLGKRTILFFTTRAQVDKFSKMLDKEGIEHAVHMTGRKELEDFDAETGTKDILLCINMLEQGYDDPSLEVGIMVAYQNSLTKNIQKVGRLLRPYEGIVKSTYYLIAKNTTDEEIIEKQSQIFPPGTVQIIRENKEK